MEEPKDRHKVKIGLLGSGTVGEAVQEIVFSGGLKENLGMDLEIVKIYTPHLKEKKKKWYSTYPKLFTTKAEEVTDHPEAEIIIEVLGSKEESQLAVFKELIIRSMRNGKDVVTSDKAVLAQFGKEIWGAARRYGRGLRFEACVGGGIPIIRSLSESLTAEEPDAIYGIINGTCNHVLSEMKRGRKSYEEALREAQDRGYAETNPKSDTSGIDAEAKLILLAAVTFGLQVEPGTIWRKGIEEIQAIDFLYADQKGGCTIKHLAVAKNEGSAIEIFVSPVLVPHDHFLSTIDGPTNAIFFKGKRSGEQHSGEEQKSRDWNYVFVGPGAGGGPTAIAIMGDLCELVRGGPRRLGWPPSLVAPGTFTAQSEDQICASFYIRFVVKDRAGIVGDICQTLGGEGINVSEIWQLNHSQVELKELARRYRLQERPRKMLPFVITVEQTSIGRVKKALEIIGRKDFILVEPVWFPMWRS